MEHHHIADGGTTLFAVPASATAWSIGCTLIVGAKIITGEHLWPTIVPSQHKGVGQVVLLTCLVVKAYGTSRTTLVVVVDHKDLSLVRSHKAGADTDILQIFDLAVKDIADVIAVVKLGHLAQTQIFAGLHRFPWRTNHFQIDKGIARFSQDTLQICRRHVLGRIDTETGNAPTHQGLHIGGDFILHIVRASIQIRQADQTTVLHLVAIAIGADAALGVEVIAMKTRVIGG